MHSMLFVAVIPEDRWEYTQQWKAFEGYIEGKLAPLPGIERLAENVWLLDLTASMASLGYLVTGAEGHAIAYRTLPFDAAPVFLPGGQSPSKTRAGS
jgi:hypothetical protein